MTAKAKADVAPNVPKKKRIKRLPIYTIRKAHGKTIYRVDLRPVGGTCKGFTSRKKAVAHAEQKAREKEQLGVEAISITHEDRLQLVTAQKKLHGYGATIMQAVDYYIAHYLKFAEAPTIEEICKSIIAAAERNNRRAKSIKSLTYRLGMVRRTFGERKLSSLKFDEVEKWAYEAKTPQSIRNKMATLGRVYYFSQKKGWIGENLVERLEKPSVEDKEPAVFRVAEIERLLRHAHECELVPWIVLQAFCGVRREEAERLDWSAVNMEAKAIRIAGDVAKKRARRIAEINETAEAWLKPYVKPSGKIVKWANCDNVRRELMTKCELEAWQENGLRHSFGSFHLAMYNDPWKTAALMGHRNPNVFHDHYKALVSKAEAERFWALRPK